MRALFLSDDVNQFHWSVLKSVLLILSLLPISQGILSLWQMSDASSQIIVGFIALSIFSAVLILSFYSALKATLIKFAAQQEISKFEQAILSIYAYIPMLCLAAMLSYLTTTW